MIYDILINYGIPNHDYEEAKNDYELLRTI